MAGAEQESFPDPSADPRIQALMERLRVAQEGFAQLNTARREGEPEYAVNDQMLIVARLDAIASILVRQGIIDYVEYTGEHLTREAELLEKGLEIARELKRQRSGLIVPPHRNGHG